MPFVTSTSVLPPGNASFVTTCHSMQLNKFCQLRSIQLAAPEPTYQNLDQDQLCSQRPNRAVKANRSRIRAFAFASLPSNERTRHCWPIFLSAFDLSTPTHRAVHHLLVICSFQPWVSRQPSKLSSQGSFGFQRHARPHAILRQDAPQEADRHSGKIAGGCRNGGGGCVGAAAGVLPVPGQPRIARHATLTLGCRNAYLPALGALVCLLRRATPASTTTICKLSTHHNEFCLICRKLNATRPA